MTYQELLPKDEPGKPLMDLSPGFTDRLMQRIEDHQRQQRLRRSAAFVLSIACLVGGVYAFRGRPADAQRPEVVQRQPKPADAQRREGVAKATKPADKARRGGEV